MTSQTTDFCSAFTSQLIRSMDRLLGWEQSHSIVLEVRKSDMIVSWNWLQELVACRASVAQVTERLTLSGLNLESYEVVGGDVAIDLEVTSNRPDCLGHI